MDPIRFLAITVVLFLGFGGSTEAQLRNNYYATTCPLAERLVLSFVLEHIPDAPSLAAALIRMHFNDCFVQGCDASVLLNSTSSNRAEREAAPNLTLRGFDFIDRIKALLEAVCAGVVSCADIIALAARDSSTVIGGPFWNVPTGRRDGLISIYSEALANIPAPSDNFTTLQTLFANQGLNLKDLVLLSGAHTIGIAHCSAVTTRLYNFTGVGDQDPSLDSEYAEYLKATKCKSISDNTTEIEMDPGSAETFDLSYFSLLLKGRGLFHSDAALITDATSKSLITDLLESPLSTFFHEFAVSMEKMGLINVKTGSEGQIRKICGLVNS